MDLLKTALLLTGRPGSGKTTIVKKVAASLGEAAGGFYTEEIRASGQRQGFAIVTLSGERAVLAHIHLRSPYHVGKYGVDPEVMDRVGVEALREAFTSRLYVVIDEIGKMELFSQAFRKAVLECIDGGKRVLGTIMSGPQPWADSLKTHPRVKLVRVTEESRDSLPATLLHRLTHLEAAH